MYDPMSSMSIKYNPNSVLEQLRSKIRNAKIFPSECVCRIENFTEDGEVKTIRRVFVSGHAYEVAWVVDSDVNSCMRCLKPFSTMYFRFRHHCRACGNLICAECSPYRTSIPSILDEEPLSRVCLSCFGLKVSVQDPVEYEKKQQVLAHEKSQRPLNYAAYRLMRRIIPPNITRTTYPKLKSLNIPDEILARIWNTKILWIICMHRDDILKIHVADLRSRFGTNGLDLIEMRAIWYNLPDWTINPKDFLKEEWKQAFKEKLNSMVQAEIAGTLPASMLRHPAYKGHEDLTLFRVDIPIRQLFVNIHSTESKLPVIQERRLSMDSEGEAEEKQKKEDEEDEEFQQYLATGGGSSADSHSEFNIIDVEEDEEIEELQPSVRPPLTMGLSFLGYLASPRSSVKLNPVVAEKVSSQSKQSGVLGGIFSRHQSVSSENGSVGSSVVGRGSIADSIDNEHELDLEMDAWDLDLHEGSSEGGVEISDDLVDEDAAVDMEGKVDNGVAFDSRSGNTSPLRRAATYPLADDTPVDQLIELPHAMETEEYERPSRRTSGRFEPNSADKPLKDWRSPNLISPALDSLRLSFSRQGSTGNSGRLSMSNDDLDEIDKELDDWKVPVSIDEVLEDLNGEVFKDDRSSLGSVSVRHSVRFAAGDRLSTTSGDLNIFSPAPRPHSLIKRDASKKRLTIDFASPIPEDESPVPHLPDPNDSVEDEEKESAFYRSDSDDEAPFTGAHIATSSTPVASPVKPSRSGIRPPTPPKQPSNLSSSPVKPVKPAKPILKPQKPLLPASLDRRDSSGEKNIKEFTSVFSPFTKKPSSSFLTEMEDTNADDHSPFKKLDTREAGEDMSLAAKLEIIMEYIRKGDAHNARIMVLKHKVNAEEIPVEESSRILLRCLKHMNDLEHPLETVRLLVEMLHADVNYRDSRPGTGDTALILCLHKPIIGAYLIEKGADIFLKNRNGDNSISLAIRKQEWWLIEEFYDSQQKKDMLKDADETRMREYLSWLVYGGFAKELHKHLKNGDFTVTAAQATILYGQCSENFANMKEPVDTYELLMSLMGNML